MAPVQRDGVDYSKYGDNHNYNQITGNGKLTTHDPKGGTLYAVDVFVHPQFQGLRLGRRLYDARKELCRKLNLRRIIAGGWIPGYKQQIDKMTPQQYIELVKQKELYDHVLSFQLANDFHVRKVMLNYFPENKGGYNSVATLLEWINIDYVEPGQPQPLFPKKSVVRVGVIQWQMRRVDSVPDLIQNIEFFVDAVSGYKADFVVFPEFFNAALMAPFNKMMPGDAMRQLSTYTEQIRNEMQQMAVSYNVNIISGSMPEYREHQLYNVSYLLRRDGTFDEQYKLHITPDESNYWGLKGGNKIQVFETDIGKVGILICYDVEFPELARVLAEQGMEILFVPFSTDTKNAYLRVRHCAHARAIENECYVVISGNVGNLPNVENMDIQYAQSGIFTPSDFLFSQDAVAAEAVPNTESTLIVDLNLDLLKQVRTTGSVRNLENRRLDLYKIHWHEFQG
jgi:predicted amidohydrolase/GNAT superfamily N-acetyltransferase